MRVGTGGFDFQIRVVAVEALKFQLHEQRNDQGDDKGGAEDI